MDFSAPSTYAFLAAYFLFSGFSAAAGMGGGMMLMGLMAPLFPPAVVVPLHGALMLTSNLTRVAMFYKHLPWPFLTPLLLGLVVGCLTGGQFVLALPPTLVQAFIGVAMLWFTWGSEPKLPPAWQTRLIAVVGFLHGVIGTLTGTSGLAQSLIGKQTFHKNAKVASVALNSAVLHALKIGVFLLAGVSLAPYLPLIAISIAVGMAGTWFGKHVLDTLIPDRWFEVMFKTIITVLALNLLWQVAQNIL
ncbi:MAG: TSUP family transporter [Alphaproteobacteria bacterium]